MNTTAGPWRITFDTNPDHCNLTCIMCEDHSPYSDTQRNRIQARQPRRVMDINLIEKIISESVDKFPLREIIPSTMGEPLVYKDFDKIIELCKQYNVKLNLTTNGTFPKKGAKKWAELIVPIGSDVKISWNGASKATQESIMLGHQWEKVVDNLKNFIAVRDEYAAKNTNYCRVTLQLTFLESNVAELADIVQFGIDLGVDRIKGHHLWAHFKEIKDLSMRRNAASIARWNQAAIKAIQVADDNLLANGKKILLENIYPLDNTAQEDLAPDGPCPFLGKEAWVAHDGRFNPCCAPDVLRKTLGDFGNLSNQTITDIWHSTAYQKLTQDYMKHKVCQNCNMRKPLNE